MSMNACPRIHPSICRTSFVFGAVAIVPILLGAGVPLLPNPANQIKLSLTAHRVYKTGIVSLEYAIT
jgi:hypothetical protein